MQNRVLNIFFTLVFVMQVLAPTVVHTHDGLLSGGTRHELSSHECGDKEFHRDAACSQECIMCARAKVFAQPILFFTPSTQKLQVGMPQENRPLICIESHDSPLKRAPPLA